MKSRTRPVFPTIMASIFHVFPGHLMNNRHHALYTRELVKIIHIVSYFKRSNHAPTRNPSDRTNIS